MRSYVTNSLYKANKENGSVLLVALMVLIVLTLLTFSSSKSVILQEKMTATTRDGMLAFEVAESALREAEKATVSSANSYAADGGLTGLYDGTKCASDEDYCVYMTKLRDVFAESIWTKSTKAAKSIGCGNGDPSCQVSGEYIIVKMGEINLSLTGSDEILVITGDAVELGKAAAGKMHKYKIIARGTGQNPQNTRTLVSYYAAPDI